MLRAVFIADMHVGAHWGLADPAETPRHSPGKEIQRRLYDGWCEAAAGPWHAPDVLILAGDAVEGQGRKDSGTHAWTTDVDEQVVSCADLLALWGAKRIFIVGGSKYHVMVGDSGLSAEELLARRIGAEEYPNQGHIPLDRRRRSGPHWFLTMGGVTAHVAHHVGISRVFHYKSTPIAREMLQAKLNDPMRREWERMYRAAPAGGDARAGLLADMALYQTRVVVRAHSHYFWACDAGGTLGMTLPAWKCPDPYILSRDSLGFTHLGFVGMEFKDGEYGYEKNLMRVEDIERPPHTRVGAVPATKKKRGRR